MTVAIIGAGLHEKEALTTLIKAINKLDHEIIIIDNKSPSEIAPKLFEINNLINDRVSIVTSVESKNKYHK